MSSPTVVSIIADDDDTVTVARSPEYRPGYVAVSVMSPQFTLRGHLFLSRESALDVRDQIAEALGLAR